MQGVSAKLTLPAILTMNMATQLNKRSYCRLWLPRGSKGLRVLAARPSSAEAQGPR
jgi:hypothetical protein